MLQKGFASFFIILAILVFLVLAVFTSIIFLRRGEAVPNELNRKAFYEHIKSSSGEWVENAPAPVFDNKPVTSLPSKPANDDLSIVLGSHIAANGTEKWIEVDISDQKLYAWEGNSKIYEFSISSGRPGYDTVKGEFRVWRKVRSQTYRGGSAVRGDYYNLPNVPYSLFFHEGYAIHGAYWHNDFGIKRRSSGCINLSIPNAEQIYNWAGPAMQNGTKALNSTSENPGIRVVVHE